MAGRPKGPVNKEKEKEKIEKFLLYIKNGNYVETACRASGLNRRTFYVWMEKGRQGDPDYAELAARVDQAMAEAETRQVEKMWIAADIDWKAALSWLERVYPDKWGKKQDIQVEHKVSNLMDSIVDKLRQALPPAQFRHVMKQLQSIEETGDKEIFEQVGQIEEVVPQLSEGNSNDIEE